MTNLSTEDLLACLSQPYMGIRNLLSWLLVVCDILKQTFFPRSFRELKGQLLTWLERYPVGIEGKNQEACHAKGPASQSSWSPHSVQLPPFLPRTSASSGLLLPLVCLLSVVNVASCIFLQETSLQLGQPGCVLKACHPASYVTYSPSPAL